MKLEVFKDYKKIFAFLAAGAVGLGVENLVLYIGVDIFEIGLYLSKFLALEAAIITVFYLNDYFAFQEFDKKAYALIRTNFVRAGGTIISFLGLYAGVSLGQHYLVANTFGVVVASIFNYYFERIITWDSV